MIVDWASNCERIYRTNSLSVVDASDRKSKGKQEIVYLVYLQNVLGYTEEESFQKWKEITNGVASVYESDPEQQLIKFNLLNSKSKKKKYASVNVTKHLEPVVFYQTEVDYLNELKVPRWVKQYWAALLFYYKFEHQNTNRVQKSPTLNAWCISHVDYKKKNYGGKCQDLIAQYKIQSSENIIVDLPARRGETYPCYYPGFLWYHGEIAMTCESISEIDNFLALIEESIATCPECGARFRVSAKTKRFLCEKCYAVKRRKSKASSEKKRRQKVQRGQEKGKMLL